MDTSDELSGAEKKKIESHWGGCKSFFASGASNPRYATVTIDKIKPFGMRL